IIQFSASGSRLYGFMRGSNAFPFYRMAVDASGVSIVDEADLLVARGIDGFYIDMKLDGGEIYSSTGRVIDPEARILLGTFSGVPQGALVAPDAKLGRAFFLTGREDLPTHTLLAFDRPTFLPIGSLPIPGVSGKAGSFIRWGPDGLACRTEGGQIFLIRTSLVAPILLGPHARIAVFRPGTAEWF